MGKQRTYKGTYSADFTESNLKVDQNAYYPSRKPGKYVTDDGKSPIKLSDDVLGIHVGYPLQGYGAEQGFSGPLKKS